MHDVPDGICEDDRDVGVVFNDRKWKSQVCIIVRLVGDPDRFCPEFHFLSFRFLNLFYQLVGIPEGTHSDEDG